MTPEDKRIRDYCEKRIMQSDLIISKCNNNATKKIEQIIVGEFEKLIKFIDSAPQQDKCKWKEISSTFSGHNYKTGCGKRLHRSNNTMLIMCNCGREIER